MMIALSREQAEILADVARRLPPEKRPVFHARVEAMLKQRRGHSRPADYEISEVTALALAGLMAKPVA